MIGAIAGDIIGSRFERGQAPSHDFELFHPFCRSTDDTVCTLAVARAIMDQGGFADHIRNLAREFPNSGYGGMFRKWFRLENAPAYGSWGNGAPMRVSSVGWLARSLEQVDELAEAQASVTHDHTDAIIASKAIARAIFLLSHGESRSDVGSAIENDFGYDLSEDAIEGRKWFDITAKGTSQTALSVALRCNSWEDTIRTCALRGGDTDALSCIAGSVSEAMYGVPEEIATQAKKRLAPSLLAIVQRFEEIMKTRKKQQ
jgi:ADP-ribosyl-[dinitrogen reductase] hydrolase